MSIISDEAEQRLLSTLANVRNEVDVSIPLGEDFAVHISSERAEPANRRWQVHIEVSTGAVIPDEDTFHPYIHEVNEQGEEFIEEWREMVEKLPWATETSWNFMVSKVYPSGDDVATATYRERLEVNTEDLLETVVTDEQLVKVTYSVPREMYVVVDDDVDIDDPEEVAREVPNLGLRELPLVELEPEMLRTSISPYDSPDIPTVDIEAVEDVSITPVESEFVESDESSDS